MAFSAPDPGDERVATEPHPSVEPARNPLLAVLGAGDAAVAAVARAFADAFSAASGTQRTVQQRVADLPAELEALRGRFSGDELRRALDAYRLQVEHAYTDFAGRGEETWERLRESPQVRQAITRLESFSGRAADAVVDASAATANVVEDAGAATADAGAAAADAVEEAGTATAGAIEDAGEGAAAKARKAPRRTRPAAH